MFPTIYLLNINIQPKHHDHCPTYISSSCTSTIALVVILKSTVCDVLACLDLTNRQTNERDRDGNAEHILRGVLLFPFYP